MRIVFELYFLIFKLLAWLYSILAIQSAFGRNPFRMCYITHLLNFLWVTEGCIIILKQWFLSSVLKQVGKRSLKSNLALEHRKGLKFCPWVHYTDHNSLYCKANIYLGINSFSKIIHTNDKETYKYWKKIDGAGNF